MKSEQLTVGTTAVEIIPAADVTRHTYLHHDSNQSIWIGDATVTSSTGFHLHKTTYHELVLPAGSPLYAVADLAGQVVDVLYLAD